MALPKLTNNVREVMSVTGLTHRGAYSRWCCFLRGEIDINVLMRPRDTKAHLWHLNRSGRCVVLVPNVVGTGKWQSLENSLKVGGSE